MGWRAVCSPSTARPPTTVSLDDEQGVKRILVDTLSALWATVNNLTRLRPTKRERYRVTIFGSARTKPGHWVYGEVQRDVEVPAQGDVKVALGY